MEKILSKIKEIFSLVKPYGLLNEFRHLFVFTKKGLPRYKRRYNEYARIDQLRFLSQSALIEETVAPHIVRGVVVVISTIIVALLLWASVTSVNEIAVTQGEVIPSKYVQSIQHLEGGIVSEINVAEGQLVEKGHVLIRLDDSVLKKDLAALQVKKIALQYQELRLKAFIDQKRPDFSQVTEERNTTIEQDQMQAFDSMIKARESEKNVISQQITQKEESLEILKKKKLTLEENIKLVNEERNLKKQLMDKGHVSKFDFLAIQKQSNQIQGELDAIESEMSQAQNAIAEYENRLSSLNAKFVDDAYKELDQASTELGQVNEMINKLEERIERLQIKSPSYGYVKGLKIKTIGGVIEPGKIIIEVVPLEGTLVVETKIQPRDVGHVKIGQTVKVKFSAYDYSRYGAVEGKLDYISATTFINDDGSRYYLGKVSLEKNYVGRDPNQNLIIPGMTVDADIVTGQKTVLAYLLKPIKSSLMRAFSER